MKKLWSYKLTFLVILIILYGILMPGDSVPSVPIPGIDKIVHMGMFFVLTATFSFEHLLISKKLPPLIPLVLSTFGFAVMTELMQGFLTTSRACDPKDLLADMIGVALALICWHIANKYFQNLISSIYKKR